jgi:hypothetical protein
MQDNNALMKFRKAALKVRHKAHLDQEKQQIEKEIEQSVNEMKLQLELNRLKAVEKQVGIFSIHSRSNMETRIFLFMHVYVNLCMVQNRAERRWKNKDMI